MKLQIHSIHFDADSKLLEFIENKVNKLDVFFGGIVSGEVFLKIEKDDSQENKIVEIKLMIPKSQLFAQEKSKTFEVAVDKSVEAIRRQLRKHKQKTQQH